MGKQSKDEHHQTKISNRKRKIYFLFIISIKEENSTHFTLLQ